jgi:hypothetical protein
MSSIRGEVCWSNLQPNFHGARRHHGTSPLALVFLENVHGLGNFFLSGGVAILLDPMQLDFHTLVASWQLCELYSHSMPLPFNTRPRHVFCFVVLQPWKPGMQIDSLSGTHAACSCHTVWPPLRAFPPTDASEFLIKEKENTPFFKYLTFNFFYTNID